MDVQKSIEKFPSPPIKYQSLEQHDSFDIHKRDGLTYFGKIGDYRLTINASRYRYTYIVLCIFTAFGCIENYPR